VLTGYRFIKNASYFGAFEKRPTGTHEK
jgi:hypothetical protein